MEQFSCFSNRPLIESVYPPGRDGRQLFAARLFTGEISPQSPLLCLVNPPYFSRFVVLTMGVTLFHQEGFL
jgi:hypothetical protein